jgi:hypothetical protein
MELPGFTAESSLGPTVQTYRVTNHYGVLAMDHVAPEQEMIDETEDAMLEGDDIGAGEEEMDETDEEIEG